MDPFVDLFGDGDGGEEKGHEEREQSLPPEVEEGNIEYKLKLLNPTSSRFEHLVTQMKWRLQEGRGEAIYEIGVADCGTLMGLSDEELAMSLETLMRMAAKLGATATILHKRQVFQSDLKVAEVLVRKVPDDQQFLDIRLAVLGNMEAGKSTLLGVLTHGELDNGRGKARLNLFRHLHEIQSGRTSSISLEILGLTSQGKVVNYSTHSKAEDICEASEKLITFIDLAGHQKYLKTTVFGLTARKPDFVMLVVGANTGIVGTTCEHLGFCIALQLPILVVVTKVDLCTADQVESVLKQLEDVLTGSPCKKIPQRVTTEDHVYTTAQRFVQNCICPIFVVSNVTGYNLELITKFLNTVPKQLPHQQLEQELMEFQVDDIYVVPSVGVVVGGSLTKGTIREGDRVCYGPNEEGEFQSTRITSIQRYGTPCRLVKAGQAATLALSGVQRASIRKGMMILDHKFKRHSDADVCWRFMANIYVLRHSGSTRIRKGFQSTVNVASIMQSTIIDSIEEDEFVTQGKRACVQFRFQRHPEFLRTGWRILFRDGQTQGMGEITKLIVSKIDPSHLHN